MKFTDSHCHLDFNEFSNALPKLLAQCSNLGIHRIIVPSVAPTNWQSTLTLCSTFSDKNLILLPCLGIHPWYLNDLTSKALDNLDNYVELNVNTLAAIGETGIDGTIAQQQNNLSKQLNFFEFQLALAQKHQLPIVVHHRKSHQHIVPLLKKHPNVKGIIHAFSGSYAQAKAYLDLGFKLGIGGTITYERAQKTINTVKKLPVGALVLETDAPSMPLYGYQGQANSPIRIIDVFETLAELRKEDKIVLAAQLEKNIDQLFSHSKTLPTKTTKTTG